MGCEICKLPLDVKDTSETGAGRHIGGGFQGGSQAEQEMLSFLNAVELFKRLPQAHFPVLAASCSEVFFTVGQTLIKQGDDGNTFYVIVTGQVKVVVDGVKVASLKDGDYFGENALLRDEPRMATIIAETAIKALQITRDDFQKQGLNNKLHFAKRQAVGGNETDVTVKPPDPKTVSERAMMVKAIQNNKNLKAVMTVDEARANKMIDVAWKQSVEAGEELIKLGSTDADYFYIVQEGTFEVILNTSSGGQSEASRVASADNGAISAGGSFGELALLYFAPRAATVKAKTKCLVWVIDRSNFKSVLARSAQELAKENLVHLKKVEIFSCLRENELNEVAKSLVEATFKSGETVFDQGHVGDSFYILIEGSVSVVRDGKEVAKLTGTQQRSEIFGERALLNNEARAATIKVTSPTARTLYMDKASFDMLLGPLEEIRKQGANRQDIKMGIKGKKAEASERGKIHRKDLVHLGLLGCGGFGAVELVEHTVTKATYALKALSKGYVCKSGMQQGVMREKDIQLMCNSPFIINLYETYNGSQSLYFLLELALGGELYATYNRKGFHGSVKHARFYIAGTLYAFEHLHSKKIIFRDLKPENLLLTEHGNVKLTDMGLAKVSPGKTYTTCGTPDYFAPELCAASGHTHAVDWWTLGILAYELMSGHPPFESPNPIQIYAKVNKGIDKVSFPPKLKGACEDLVKGLLRPDPADRLPMRKGGTNNVRRHAWYADFEWPAMEECKLAPPYKPIVKNAKDIANFSARKEDCPPQIAYKDDKTGWDKDFATGT